MIETPSPRRWPVLLVVLLGLMLTAGVFASVRRADEALTASRFERQAETLAGIARDRIARHLEVLYVLRDYFDAEPAVSRADFAAMARGPLARHPGIRALEWVPAVTDADRGAFEAAARRAGMPGFRLTEVDAAGRLVPAARRPLYHPVLYVEPWRGNQRALGYAPALPARDAAIARATDGGEAAATGRFVPVQTPKGRWGVAVFLPVYAEAGAPETLAERRATLRGLVEGFFVIDEMLGEIQDEARAVGLTCALADASAPGGEALYAPATPGRGLRHDVGLDVGGRRWVFTVRLADAAALGDVGAAPAWVLALGLLVTAGIAGYLALILGARARVERLVVERTAALRVETARAERLAAEAAVREAELRHAQAIDQVKTDFASAVSHDLRTPLTSVGGYAEFLGEEVAGPLTTEQRYFVTQILRGTKRLTHMVDDLLDYARLDAGALHMRREPADVAATVRAAVEGLAPQLAGAGLGIAVDAPGPLVAPIDAERIERVVVNLVGNAIKFTHPGGRIGVALRDDGDVLRCEVSDTGLGIATAQLPRLFRRFSQLEAGVLRGGAGLGLSICQAIVEAHGGAIGVRSQPGHGSVFWFTLPKA